MEINKNGLYGGAPAFSYKDADGWIYYLAVMEGPDGFGTYVYRTKDGGQSERVAIEYFSPMRGAMSLEPDGLWVTLFRGKNDANGLVRIPVPGFKMPGFPSNGNTAPSTPTNGGEAAVDTEARAKVSALTGKVDTLAVTTRQETENLWTAIIADRKRLTALEKTPTSGGVTKADVEAIAWAKALDAQYWGITAPESDARKELIKLIVATAPNTPGDITPEIVKLVADEVDTAVQEIVTKVLVALQSKG